MTRFRFCMDETIARRLRHVLIGSTVLLTGFIASAQSAPHAAEAFDPGLAGFSISVGELVIPYRIAALSVMPGERLHFQLAHAGGRDGFVVNARAGDLIVQDAESWSWSAPEEPGLYPLIISDGEGDASMVLNVFVLVPLDRSEDGKLNGYRIGHYPSVPYKDLEIYQPPKGFIEVTPDLLHTPVSPHFNLSQFVSKQAGGFPKYMLLRTRLLLKLELILAELNVRGNRCNTLALISGFRTPYYNDRINNVDNSRHIWGGAADVFVDAMPKDGIMDDLNGDGVSSIGDAEVLYEIIDEIDDLYCFEPLLGGLGLYRRENGHEPFVHVDVRGFRARWGVEPRSRRQYTASGFDALPDEQAQVD